MCLGLGGNAVSDAVTERLIDIGTERPVWNRFFTVAPLVLIGTTDADGSPDLAPKHMVTPMGWENYFGFVCTPAHCTCQNIQRRGGFTVSYPKPSQVLFSSLAASPRQDGHKPVLDYFTTFNGREVDAPLIEEAYLYFECRHHKTVDGFGSNCLITGEIIAAYAEPEFLRSSEIDDQELVHDSPLFAFLAPDRFATIEQSNAFPFPANMKQ
ncbi:MAG: flavin reductase [Woeseiaceae bacterium]|nr:flavin reductase [Woeseiaceae bacterium]